MIRNFRIWISLNFSVRKGLPRSCVMPAISPDHQTTFEATPSMGVQSFFRSKQWKLRVQFFLLADALDPLI